jgi:maltose phosphorylase
MSVIKGFAGMRIKDGKLAFTPFLPEQWKGYSFRIGFRGQVVRVAVRPSEVEVENLSSQALSLAINGTEMTLTAQGIEVVRVR